jgi:CheY-like chemotaxis protein
MMALSAYRRQLHKEPIIFEFALSGAEALRRLLSDTPPRLVVADLVMPEPGGAEVLRRAIAHDSSWNRRFVIVTGIALHEANKQLDPRFCGRVFQKPVEIDELSDAIREALNLAPLYAAAGKVRAF